MKRDLERLRAGDIGFNEFVIATRADWRALSTYLMRRWPLPPCVDVEDIEQELLLACVRFIPKYDPSRGRSLKDFIVFNCCSAAKGWIHAQRGALGRRDNAVSRHPLAFSGMKEGEFEMLDYVVFSKPVQEQVVAEREHMAMAYSKCRNERDHLCVTAIVEARGDIERAANWLYADFNTRRRCRFNCREDVRRAIRRTAIAVAA